MTSSHSLGVASRGVAVAGLAVALLCGCATTDWRESVFPTPLDTTFDAAVRVLLDPAGLASFLTVSDRRNCRIETSWKERETPEPGARDDSVIRTRYQIRFRLSGALETRVSVRVETQRRSPAATGWMPAPSEMSAEQAFLVLLGKELNRVQARQKPPPGSPPPALP